MKKIKCKTCQIEKPVSHFYRSKITKSGLHGVCSQCQSIKKRNTTWGSGASVEKDETLPPITRALPKVIVKMNNRIQGTIRYKGVHIDPRYRVKPYKYRALFKNDAKDGTDFLGTFDTAWQAAKAFNRAAVEVFGDRAFVNTELNQMEVYGDLSDEEKSRVVRH